MGVNAIEVVYDPKEEPIRDGFPKSVGWHERSDLPQVMERLKTVQGVSAIIFVQTCAAEKRRRRKRGTFPDPEERIFINTDVCEGCGDCGVQSNCVAIVPVETELGRKRAIDQSTCNKDYSCVKGFCPSFVTVTGGTIRKEATAQVDTGDLPNPDLPSIDGTWNVVITGVGGTGVVTIGAVLAMAAHLDGRGAGMMEMAGLAQKGGAVAVHCRIGKTPGDISAIRVATGEADAIIGGDLVVSAGAKTIGLMAQGRTGAVVNSHDIVTGDFTRNTEFRIPSEDLSLALKRRLRDRLVLFDATDLARAVMGDTIFSNMITFGAAWQAGLIPVTLDALQQAISLNGAAVDANLRAFEIGRWAVHAPDDAARAAEPRIVQKPRSLDEKIAFRADHLTQYQGKRLAKRYRKLVDGIEDTDLKLAVAEGYHKLLSYKDEYEVARLLKQTRDRASETFDGDLTLTYHLAPPTLTKTEGRPDKKQFGQWVEHFYPMLAKGRVLRGTVFDPFGRSAERRMERALITQYEADMKDAIPKLDQARDAVIALARLPLDIRGFGPVKQANAEKAAKRREEFLAAIRSGPSATAQAAE